VTRTFSKNHKSRCCSDLPDCLGYEIADNTTIINVHSGSISVENSGNSYLWHRGKNSEDVLDVGNHKERGRERGGERAE
jgi:hypothetical protein